MRFRTLGKTGLRVSEISLGTVEIGIDYGLSANGPAARPSEAEAFLLLHRALNLGINFIDTARAYGDSEAIIGRSLKERRTDFVVCSKVQVQPIQPFDALRRNMIDSVETSLRLLSTDFVDIMMIHSASAEVVACEEITTVLGELRNQGRLRWIGVSVYSEGAALAAIHSGRYDCVQVAYNALDRGVESSVLGEAERANVGIVARSVLLKGVLTDRYRYLPHHLDALQTAARELEQVASEAGVSLPELAYRYVLSRPVPHSALVGASNLEELESAVRFVDAGPLPSEAIARIRKVKVSNEELLNPSKWG